MIYLKEMIKKYVKIFNILYDFIEYYMKNYQILNLINFVTVLLIFEMNSFLYLIFDLIT